MKRWIWLLLALVLATGSLFSVPRVSAAGGKSWDRLLAIESRADETAAAQTVEGRAALYASRGEQMIQAVCAASDYEPGSLERHGDFFFWRTTDGRANGYAPSFRARIRDKNAEGEILDVPTRSFGGIAVFAIPEFGRFYRHVLLEKRYPHHGAVAFGRIGRVLFDAFRFMGVQDIAYNQPASLPYPTENPWA